MGVCDAALTVGLFVVALTAVFGIVDRFRSRGIAVEAARGQIACIVRSDLAALVAFTLFIARRILRRNVPTPTSG